MRIATLPTTSYKLKTSHIFNIGNVYKGNLFDIIYDSNKLSTPSCGN